MKKLRHTIYFTTLMILLNISGSLAQAWMVGVPVNDTLTTVGGYTGGCTPNADFEFTFAGCYVTGVNYYLVVTNTPANVKILPSNDTISIGDTIPFLVATSNTFGVYCFSGTGGQVVFDIRAFGTPTTTGQQYPCSVSPFWMSNLQLCPEGLQNNVQNNCVVVPFTGLNEIPVNKFDVIYPVASNNHNLEVAGKFSSLSVTDITGKIIYQSGPDNKVVFGMNHLPAGIYNLVIFDGASNYNRKFNKQ